MKFLFSLITFFLFFSFTNASAKSALSKTKNETLDELKQELNVASDAEKKLYIKSKIVKKYASEPLTSTNIVEAKSFAESILKTVDDFKKDWNYGNIIHHGNLVLGRIRLFQGDSDGAKKYLVLASKTPGSPQLDSFGPNMTLARELLEKGEKDSVLKYLDACLVFWKIPHAASEASAWKQSISEGKVPDFKGNLFY